MKRFLTIIFVVSVFATASIMTGCLPENADTAQKEAIDFKKGVQERVQKQIKLPSNFTPMVEAKNIQFRALRTANPGTIMYMYKHNMHGDFFLRVPVVGKVTSTSKRLFPTWEVIDMDNYVNLYSSANTGAVVEAADIFGTHGHSTARIFWMTPTGNYWECDPNNIVITDAPYLLKDKRLDYMEYDMEALKQKKAWESAFWTRVKALGKTFEDLTAEEYSSLAHDAFVSSTGMDVPRPSVPSELSSGKTVGGMTQEATSNTAQ